MTLKDVIKRVWRERTIIGGVITAIGVELVADLDNPDFHWRDLVPIVVGVAGRFFTTPWPIDPEAKSLAGLRKK